MKRFTWSVVLVLAMVAVIAVLPAAAEVRTVEIPLNAVFYCPYAQEHIILEGAAESEWTVTDGGATALRVSFAGVHGIGALTGRSYDIPGAIYEQFMPALGALTGPRKVAETVRVCLSGTDGPGACVDYELSFLFVGFPGGDQEKVALITGRLGKL